MGLGRESLHLLIDDPGPCPICDGWDCNHQFYGQDHYRFGDPMSKHPIIGRRHIPSDRRIERDGHLLFAVGALMTDEEALEHGVPYPGRPAPGRKKGRRQRLPTPQTDQKPAGSRPAITEHHDPQGPVEDRARRPGRNRTTTE